MQDTRPIEKKASYSDFGYAVVTKGHITINMYLFIFQQTIIHDQPHTLIISPEISVLYPVIIYTICV